MKIFVFINLVCLSLVSIKTLFDMFLSYLEKSFIKLIKSVSIELYIFVFIKISLDWEFNEDISSREVFPVYKDGKIFENNFFIFSPVLVLFSLSDSCFVLLFFNERRYFNILCKVFI